MIQNLTIQRFQSLHDVELELGAFTVIVGPSSSGKSALVRSIKTLAANQRGHAFIEHGHSDCLIAAHTDTARVVLKRSNKQTGNEYLVRGADDEDDIKYTKLSGATPEEVSESLRLSSDTSLWCAGQFDRPYLLAESGPEVARTLGELTNVSVLFEAAREANRQRGGASSTLKTRMADEASLKARVEAFEDLELRVEAQGRAEVLFEALNKDVRALADMQEQWERLLVAAQAYKSAKSIHEAASADLDSLEERLQAAQALQEQNERMQALWLTLVAQARSLKRAQAEQEELQADIEALEQEYHDALHEMGTCPTCGATV